MLQSMGSQRVEHDRATELFYNVVLVSAVQQSDSATHTHTSCLFWTCIYTHWVFIGRTDAEAETLILWPPRGKS